MGNKVETTHWKMAVIDRNTTVICDWFRGFFNHGRVYRRGTPVGATSKRKHRRVKSNLKAATMLDRNIMQRIYLQQCGVLIVV